MNVNKISLNNSLKHNNAPEPFENVTFQIDYSYVYKNKIVFNSIVPIIKGRYYGGLNWVTIDFLSFNHIAYIMSYSENSYVPVVSYLENASQNGSQNIYLITAPCWDFLQYDTRDILHITDSFGSILDNYISEIFSNSCVLDKSHFVPGNLNASGNQMTSPMSNLLVSKYFYKLVSKIHPFKITLSDSKDRTDEWTLCYLVYMFDEYFNYLGYQETFGWGPNKYTCTLPTNVRYYKIGLTLRTNGGQGGYVNDSLDIVNRIFDTYEDGFGEFYLTNGQLYNNESNSVWKGKKIGFLGDSITSDNYKYVDAYLLLTGCTVNNLAVSGSSLAGNSALCMCHRYTSLDNDCEMVIVLGGVNDHRGGMPLGEFEYLNNDGSLDNTFYGALHTLCRGLKEKYVRKPIVFMTPMHNSYRDESYGDTGDYNYELFEHGILQENKFPLRDKIHYDESVATGGMLSEYVEAIKKVCQFYSLPVIDLYSISTLLPLYESNKNVYVPDGIHPAGYPGALRIAKIIYPILENMNYYC